MKPWEHEACDRRSTPQEKRSYKRWINELAAGIADTPMLVVMQPDGPFLWCTPDKAAKSRLLTYATKKLSALSRTSVYIDAGAADWCENGRGNDPERCAQLLMRTGIEYARGFALDSTHYTGPADNIAHGTKIVSALRRAGYGTKHFIIDTAKSGRPTMWNDMVPEGQRPCLPDQHPDPVRHPGHPADDPYGEPEVGVARRRPGAGAALRGRVRLVRPALALLPGRPVRDEARAHHGEVDPVAGTARRHPVSSLLVVRRPGDRRRAPCR
jgi:hypothetical protein